MTAKKCLVVGDNVTTDQIYPARYPLSGEPSEIARHVLEGLDSDLPLKIDSQTLLVAGENFGCGVPRMQAAAALKHSGITCIVAKSASRTLYRSAINLGIMVIIADIVDKVTDGDEIEIDYSQGKIMCRDFIADFTPLPDFIQKIINAGGLLPYIRQGIAKK
ncbi:MAG: 3-isopropylmalate dehydratase small subunit [Candidatus Zixiibacteriota bacterium]|nr:MAG: 3-isopropylmalate dehydratase small subunit [candidate division Zixibacteria bacterium]